jgi:hypothetical protein
MWLQMYADEVKEEQQTKFCPDFLPRRKPNALDKGSLCTDRVCDMRTPCISAKGHETKSYRESRQYAQNDHISARKLQSLAKRHTQSQTFIFLTFFPLRVFVGNPHSLAVQDADYVAYGYSEYVYVMKNLGLGLT